MNTLDFPQLSTVEEIERGFESFGYICSPKISSDMAKKGNRVQVILECTEHKNSGMPGTSRYITTKNRKNTTGSLELKKYNSVLSK